MDDKHSDVSSSKEVGTNPQRRKFPLFLCPPFCRKRKVEPIKVEEEYDWKLSEVELAVFFNYLGMEEGEGFNGILPHKLHNAWEEFMMPDIYELWILYIYGSREDILPDFKKFCELVKGQWYAPLDIKVKIIFAILSRRNHEEIEKSDFQIIKHDVIKYFFSLMATYLRGMGYQNSPEFLMWVHCNADFNEDNLRIAMRFFTDLLPDMASKEDLCRVIQAFPILAEILTAVIRMSFAMGMESNFIIPFPITTNHTILDIAQIVLLTSFVREGYECYEWEMLYSTPNHGLNWTYFVRAVLQKGPTIIVVKDQDGWIFGGYGNKSWRVSPKFFGTNKCFLFRLFPTFKLFRSSNLDDNYMYLNHGQYTMPNGLAMGGFLNYFGIWIDIDKPEGRCENSCTTFEDFECLSFNNDFLYLHLEVWRVSPKGLISKPRKSISFERATLIDLEQMMEHSSNQKYTF